MRTLVQSILAGLLLTVASSVIERHRLEVQDWDCPPAPASCARPVLVLGYPFAYVSDYHGISVVNSASLTGAMLGEDHLHATAFIGNVLLYSTLVFGLLALGRRARDAVSARATRE
jgi:hypothetical protein